MVKVCVITSVTAENVIECIYMSQACWNNSGIVLALNAHWISFISPEHEIIRTTNEHSIPTPVLSLEAIMLQLPVVNWFFG